MLEIFYGNVAETMATCSDWGAIEFIAYTAISNNSRSALSRATKEKKIKQQQQQQYRASLKKK